MHRQSASSRVRGTAPRSALPYIDVHDRGSDLTVVSLAGPLGRVAGMPYGFEFKSLTKRTEFNLVFLRDVHKAFYQSTPDGKPGGLDFFADTISDAVASLGGELQRRAGLLDGWLGRDLFRRPLQAVTSHRVQPDLSTSRAGQPAQLDPSALQFWLAAQLAGGLRHECLAGLCCAEAVSAGRALPGRAGNPLLYRGVLPRRRRTEYHDLLRRAVRGSIAGTARCWPIARRWSKSPCRRGSITRAAT